MIICEDGIYCEAVNATFRKGLVVELPIPNTVMSKAAVNHSPKPIKPG